jgi:hypothetical protein
VPLPPETESPAIAIYGEKTVMATFLNTSPSGVRTTLIPVSASGGQGESVRTATGPRACASAARLALPNGAQPVAGVVGWLHPAVMLEGPGLPMYVIGQGQPVTIGPLYLYVPSCAPGNVIRSPSPGSGDNPVIVWGFWRSRYFGELSIQVFDWL